MWTSAHEPIGFGFRLPDEVRANNIHVTTAALAEKTVPDEATRRALLFSARLRFSSPTQPIRHAAIDRIVQQNLLFVSEDDSVSPQQLCAQGAFRLNDGTEILQLPDVEESLKRMGEEGIVEIFEATPPRRSDAPKNYALSQKARDALMQEQAENQARVDRILRSSFDDRKSDQVKYGASFLDVVALIFSKLGESYVSVICEETTHEEVARGPLVQAVLKELGATRPLKDWECVQRSVIRFIEDSSPDAVYLKWNLAQNYYVAKALGIDDEGRVLSDEVFGEAELYLDTNIVIPALEPLAQHHANFKALAQACSALAVNLNVCQITIDETRSSVRSQRDILEKVASEIPDALANRVDNDFFTAYRERMKQDESLEISDLFTAFDNPAESLRNEYGVELVDDSWFVEERPKETEELAQKVSAAWVLKTGKVKSPGVSRHDALLLGWVKKRREEGSPPIVLLITRDHTLPDVHEVDEAPLAMMLDAFIQWVSPLASRESPDVDFAQIFCEAIKQELLPQRNFLDPKDFIVFHEMELSVKELPIEDVENCIRHLKQKMPELDPRRADHREKLTAEINRFLVSPGRKFRREIERLENEKQDILQSSKAELESNVQEFEKRLSEKDAELTRSSVKVGHLETTAAQAKLRKSALIRLSIIFVFLLAAETLLVFFVLDGAKPKQAVVNVLGASLPLFGLPLLWFLGTAWFVLGKDRIRALGFPFDKILRED